MYKIKQLADIANITTKTLRHYEKIGLLIPLKKENNYRYYRDKDIYILQQIIFYKELDFSLEEIKKIINDGDFDIIESLGKQINLLERKKERLDNIITLAKKTLQKQKGEINMTKKDLFEAFKEKLISDNEKNYKEEVVNSYGIDSYNKSKSKLKNMTESEYLELEKLSNDVNCAFLEAFKTKNVKSTEAKYAVGLHQKWLMYYWTEFSIEAYTNLARMYVDDSRFAKYYDKLEPNMAEFVRDSILAYYNM